jgi:hypothetical protein
MKTLTDYLGQKNKPTLFIGLTGVAGAGKDLFFSSLKDVLEKKDVSIKRMAIADGLKEEVSSFTRSAYAINSEDCTREEKEILRPFLVFHGSMRRKKSGGRYWIDLFSSRQRVLFHDLKLENKPKPDIICITDVRFDDFEKDEVYWLKKELKGVLVHISQYKMVDGKKIFREPANKEEARNDPKIKAQADYELVWEYRSGEEKEARARQKTQQFLDWYCGYVVRNE